MKNSLYSVLDTKVGNFTPPFISRNSAEALRGFSQAAQDPSTAISKFPEDFILYHIGHFEDDTGIMESILPVALGTGSQFAIKK